MADSEVHSNNSDILIAYYKQQFAEIYHLDTLDWRVALILFPTFGGFFGVLGYLNTINATTNALLPSEFGAFRAFSVFLVFLSYLRNVDCIKRSGMAQNSNKSYC